nr:E2 [Human papillomavirus]
METQGTLTARFNALQDAILTLYEEGHTDLQSQIDYWELVRKEQVLLYYARKEGYTRLGLQPTPTPVVSEYNAKEAIKISLLLKSLLKSKYAKEQWTLPETSAELLNTEPKNCFKKSGYTVEVLYDNNENNAVAYTNWDFIYYQDSNDIWHKVNGRVDIDGLFYEEINGDRVYFGLFEPDSQRYGVTGTWTVKYKNTTISSSDSSFRHPSSDVEDSERPGPSTRDTETPTQSITTRGSETSPISSTTSHIRLRRGGEQRERGTKRRRVVSPGRQSVPSPGEVGSRLRSTPRSGLSRLQRLQEEARDPPIIIVEGPANSLKCWRNRLPRYSTLYLFCTTVFKWIGDGLCSQSRMLISFHNEQQRYSFLEAVKLPKHSSYAYGALNKL